MVEAYGVELGWVEAYALALVEAYEAALESAVRSDV
jgi:hypothetical protein